MPGLSWMALFCKVKDLSNLSNTMVRLLSMDVLCVCVPVPWRCYVLCVLQWDAFQLLVQSWHVVFEVDCDIVGGGGGVWEVVASAFHFPPSRLWLVSSNVLVWCCRVSVSTNLLSTSLLVLSRSCLSLATVFYVSSSYCLSKFFFWRASSILCWASRSLLNLSNSSLSLLFSSTSLWLMLGEGDSDGCAEACDWDNTCGGFSALPGQWLSSADLWATNLELRWGGSLANGCS